MPRSCNRPPQYAYGLVVALAYVATAHSELIVPVDLQYEGHLVGAPSVSGDRARPLDATTMFVCQNTRIAKFDLKTGIQSSVAGRGLPGQEDGVGSEA
eukprot:3246858-Rhodomonas_salina.1